VKMAQARDRDACDDYDSARGPDVGWRWRTGPDVPLGRHGSPARSLDVSELREALELRRKLAKLGVLTTVRRHAGANEKMAINHRCGELVDNRDHRTACCW
jgi:hypothetical protein